MGSGILFLPSLSYQLAGPDVLAAWGLTTLFCLPLLLIFSDMVRAVPTEHGISGFIDLGLGKHIAASVPILMLGTVGLGMPSAALIAGRYFSRMFGGGAAIEAGAAVALAVLAIVANIRGVRSSSLVQRVVSFGLFGLAAGLFALTTPAAMPHFESLAPVWDLKRILAGSVVAFWAFAGFENMTFTAGEFRRPHRDIMASISLSLLLCGALYFGLTANYAALIAPDSINSIVGLAQLAEHSPQKALVAVMVTLFAIGAVLINLTSWSWGISRLVYASAGEGALPRFLHKLSERDVPKRALLGMLALFCVVIGFGASMPNAFEAGLQVVSTNFVVLYLLCLVSYVRFAKQLWKKALGVVLAGALCLFLTSSGWLVVYPAALIAVAAILSKSRERGGEVK
jgi:amino acid efflux transporter